jgi:16S rRNA (guanine527-N7)-methyltransferase
LPKRFLKSPPKDGNKVYTKIYSPQILPRYFIFFILVNSWNWGKNLFMEVLTKYFTDFTEKQLQQFAALKDLYQEWNQKINVISRKYMDHFYEHHVLHSLAIATQFDFPEGYEIMDLGAGGGFPGIPLAIFFPGVHFHLVDSTNKKLKVVEAIVSAIELKNVTVQHSRVEDIKDKKFDVVVSRAVASLKDLWFWSKPLLKKRPVDQPKKITGLISLKGGDLSQEITESKCHPRIWQIDKIFEEEFFEEKFLLLIS